MCMNRMMKLFGIFILGVLLSLCVTFTVHASATDDNSGVTFGMEVDMLPYLSGGHYLSGVVGYDHYNLRLISTKTTVPGFASPKGYKDWDLDVNAIIIDYFPNENREGFWIANGVEFWDSHIRNKNTGEKGSFSQKILTLGCGYTYNINDHLYINPWAAIHYNLSDSNVPIGSSNLNLPDIMYEASVKLGYTF
jgi:hypothetical protein